MVSLHDPGWTTHMDCLQSLPSLGCKLLLAALLIAFTACVAQAQIFGTVRGTVVDPQGAMIPGATVALKAHASAFTKTTQTDESGLRRFRRLLRR